MILCKLVLKNGRHIGWFDVSSLPEDRIIRPRHSREAYRICTGQTIRSEPGEPVIDRLLLMVEEIRS